MLHVQYTLMPAALRCNLLHPWHATLDQRRQALNAIQRPTAVQYELARELELEPMPGDAPRTGAEDRAQFPYHEEVQGLGGGAWTLEMQEPADGRDLCTREMAREGGWAAAKTLALHGQPVPRG